MTTRSSRPKRQRSDALVFFGATGDLAYKKIFPALHAMAKRGKLDFPVVGVARSGWTREQLIERARASVHRVRRPGTESPSPSSREQLRYVDGDYNDPVTFQHLKEALGECRRPTHYLAIPPSMFPTVVHSCTSLRLHHQRARGGGEALRA
jgi:glucose-6-phosphate 1-dehydrogenase